MRHALMCVDIRLVQHDAQLKNTCMVSRLHEENHACNLENFALHN